MKERVFSAKPSQGMQSYIPEKKIPDGKIKAKYFDGRRYNPKASEQRKEQIKNRPNKRFNSIEDAIAAYEFGIKLINSVG